jgi:hypothetical protein
MNNQPHHSRERHIDSAALAASAIAAVLAVSLVKGPYYEGNFIVGVTLTVLILAYEISNQRTFAQTVALGAVLGLCSLLYLGYLTDRFVFHTSPDADDSNVSPMLEVYFWFVVTIIFSVLDVLWFQRRARRKRSA